MKTAEKEIAKTKTVPDLLAPNLKIIFCGINPGLFTAFSGHHYARPGNRFWKALYDGGFTPRLLKPEEDAELLKYGYGLTNIVARASLGAAELSKEEYVEGGKILVKKLKIYKPEYVAFVGIQAYRTAFNQPKATTGQQDFELEGTKVWVLPSTSGLNAHYSPTKFAEEFRNLKNAAK